MRQHKEQEYEEQQEYQEQEYQEHDEQETPHLRRSLRLQKIQKPSSKPQRELSKKKNVNVIVVEENHYVDDDNYEENYEDDGNTSIVGKQQPRSPPSPIETPYSRKRKYNKKDFCDNDENDEREEIKLHSSTTTLPNKSTQLKSTKISSSSLEEQSKSSPNTTPSTIRGSPCSTKSISPLSLRSPLLLQMSSPVIQSSPVTVNNPQLPSKSLSPPHSRPRSRPCSVSPNERPIIIIENNIHNRYQNIDERDNNGVVVNEQRRGNGVFVVNGYDNNNNGSLLIFVSPCSTKSISPLSLRSPLLLQMSSPVIQSSPVTVNNPQLPSKSLSPPHSRPRSRPCSVSPNERPIIIIENNIHNRYQNIDERDNNGVVVNEQRRGNGVFVVNGYDNNNNGSVVFRNVDNNDGDDILVLNDQVEEDRLLTQYDSDRNLKNARDFEEDDSDDFIVDFDDKRAKELLRLFA
ncbi:10025_t:CDS:2 [Entrophospora sp. SA101]|nr:10025_t:CDS:2 [Entrophospora sp. SA101]